MDEFLSFAALNPGSIGPTLPPVPPFQFPTGSTGPTGFNLPAGPVSIILTSNETTACVSTQGNNTLFFRVKY